MSRKNLITITTVMHHINRLNNQRGIKSVPSPLAQTFDSCDSNIELEEMHLTIEIALKHWKKHYPIIYHFAVIQLASGARVSELLRLHSNDISEQNRIFIRSLKNGVNRTVQITVETEWLQRERSLNRYLFPDLSRFVIHREYVKQGVAAHFGNNSKRSTTHLFRHLVGLDLKSISDETEAIKAGIGQKTDQATNYYKTKIRRKND